jgi:hypothetical protein
VDVPSSTARLSISASAMDDIVASASPIAIPAESHSVGAPDYTNETDGNSLVFFCPLLLYVIYQQDNYGR